MRAAESVRLRSGPRKLDVCFRSAKVGCLLPLDDCFRFRPSCGSEKVGCLLLLVDLMCTRVLRSHVINADETPVPVLDPTRDSTRKSYLWTYLGDSDHPFTVFDHRDSRSRDGPTEILKNYRGFLQTDAYTCYDSVVLRSNGRIVPVGCWAHARRGFFDARANHSREAHYALSLIGQLYDVEEDFRKSTANERLAARQERSVPVLDRLKTFLDEQTTGALPKSQYGKAIGYVRNQWESLRRYLKGGRLAIDNNTSERTLRVAAIGRNYAQFPIMRSSCTPVTRIA
jgi:transposase